MNKFSMVLLIWCGIVCHAFSVEIDLPPETATYKPSDLPGYQLVQKNCIACHSAQYASTQPPSSPRSYWLATVNKMQKVFGAPIPAADIPEMVDYLVKIYGNEKTVSGAPRHKE